MKALKNVAFLSAAAVILCLPQAAKSDLLAERFYMKADAGAVWVMDTDLEEFFGEVTPGAEVEFEPGPRFGFGLGYSITDWLAAEAEVGFMYNLLDNVTDSARTDALFGQMPFLLNARFQWPNAKRLIPYAGAGAGGSAMFLDADDLEIGGTQVGGTGSDVVFAWQFFGGLRYKLTDNIDLGVEYRYFGAQQPEFDGDSHGFHMGDESIEFGRIEGHALSLAVQFRF